MANSETNEDSEHRPRAQFTQTHWSVVLSAAQPSSSQADAALETLCRTYWLPLYAYVRRQGHGMHDAQDLTQEFLARLIKHRSFAGADRTKGRFRTYLLGAFNHFLADQWDKARAEKRGGNVEFISLNDTQNAERLCGQEPSMDLAPEKLFDRRWGLALLQIAMERLKAECAASDKPRQFELLKPFLTSDGGPGDYDRAAAELNTTPGSVAVSVHRLRQRFRKLVRSEVAQTVESPAEVDDELRALFS